MVKSEQQLHKEARVESAIEAAIRIGVLFLLVMWTLKIVGPFVMPVIWGLIIAVACYPIFAWLRGKMGGRNGLAATTFSLVALIILVVPVVWLTGAGIDWVQSVATQLKDGTLAIPEASPRVAEWPFIGDKLYAWWAMAYSNLSAAVESASEPLKAFGLWLLKAIASMGSGVLMFTFSIIIAGIFLAHASGGSGFATRLFTRLAPASGPGFAKLAEQTVRGVATGVLGVALIQTVLLSLGFVVAGIPAAAVLSFICLVICVVQLPPTLIVIPVIIYMFSSDQYSTMASILFTLWMIPSAMSDTFLKPIMLGRGSDAPMLVIFIGAIGGFIASGIVGLFTGAVVTVLGYELFHVWLEDSEPASIDDVAADLVEKS